MITSDEAMIYPISNIMSFLHSQRFFSWPSSGSRAVFSLQTMLMSFVIQCLWSPALKKVLMFWSWMLSNSYVQYCVVWSNTSG